MLLLEFGHVMSDRVTVLSVDSQSGCVSNQYFCESPALSCRYLRSEHQMKSTDAPVSYVSFLISLLIGMSDLTHNPPPKKKMNY